MLRKECNNSHDYVTQDPELKYLLETIMFHYETGVRKDHHKEDTSNPQVKVAHESDYVGQIGNKYRTGNNVPRNPKVASLLLEEATKLNQKWRYDYIESLSVSEDKFDRKKAFMLCKKYSDSGDSHSMMILGKMYRDGVGTKINKEAAINYLRDAYEAGEKNAIIELFEMRHDFPSDEIMGYIKYEASRGNEKIQHLYVNELINTQNYTELKNFLDVGTKNNDPNCTAILARCYRDGVCVSKDYDIASGLYFTAYENGCKWALNEAIILADASRDDKLIKKIVEQISKIKVTDTECLISYSNLLYHNGTDSDLLQSYNIILPIACKGNKDALFRLGQMYRNGRGVNKDIVLGTLYIMLSKEKGHKGAVDELNVLIPKYNNSLDVREKSISAMLDLNDIALYTDELKKLCLSCIIEGSGVAALQLGIMYKDHQECDFLIPKWLLRKAIVEEVSGAEEKYTELFGNEIIFE